MTATVPTTIEQYLAAVREALGDADPALIQDALYDAEEYLRSELAEQRGKSEAEVVAKVARSYGAPDEVAAIYRDTEVKVERALRAPPAPPRRSLLGRFFGVIGEPRAWAGMIYMFLALATGIVYFTVVVTGVSLSAGLAILIIGVPFVILFIGLVRMLALVEGRIVETLLGERMPRRPLYADRGQPLMARIGAMFTDPRTWSTLLYFVLMLPLGIVYFTIAVTGLSLALGFTAAPILWLLWDQGAVTVDGMQVVHWGPLPPAISAPILFVGGIVLFFAMLHLARGVAAMHGAIAKNLLVKSAQY